MASADQPPVWVKVLEESMYIRLSRGTYPPSLHAQVDARLRASVDLLIPAIRLLPGCLSYYAGSDESSCSMVNISVWDTLDHAEAMSSLAPMVALGREFVQMGVEFERPIVNYAVSWSLP
jgi:quinol monooxygenase YgiN